MSAEVEAFLGTWHWHPSVDLSLLALGTTYAVGWWRIRRQGHRRLASIWRLLAYEGGLGSVALALVSPIDHLAEVLFTAHMIQHQLLIMVAAPLLLLGNPFPFVLWGLPRRLRRRLGGALTRGGAVRRVWRTLTWIPVAGLAHTMTLWAWHLPAAYEAALRTNVLHDIEHLSFFGTALLFWWPVVDPAPRDHASRDGLYYGARVAYLVLATAQNTLLGALIGLTERVLYPSYAAAPRVFGLTPLDDQALSGGIMWAGGHMYLIAILILVGQAMNAEGRETSEPTAQSHPEAPR
ncbi:MAG: cytochrome c oxidase assembly protein [Candidatus Rokuibacteriota bacterium]